MHGLNGQEPTFAPVDKAAEYRAKATEMIKCAKAAATAARADYFKLAKVWSLLADGADGADVSIQQLTKARSLLAGGADVGIQPEERCEEQDT